MIFFAFLMFPKTIFQLIPSYRMSSFMGEFEWKQLYKPSNYEYKRYNSFQTGNLKFNVSEKYPFNFDTPIPAISESFIFDYQKAKIFPQWADPNNIRKGFISKKMNLEQQKQVQKINNEIKKSYK